MAALSLPLLGAGPTAVFGTVWCWIPALLGTVWCWIPALFGTVWCWIPALFGTIWCWIPALFGTVWCWIHGLVRYHLVLDPSSVRYRLVLDPWLCQTLYGAGFPALFGTVWCWTPSNGCCWYPGEEHTMETRGRAVPACTARAPRQQKVPAMNIHSSAPCTTM